MKRIAVFLLLASSVLATSPGTPVELVMPAGTAALTPTTQSVAMNDSYILIGVIGASYKAPAGGPEISGAGEVLVFNASTGAFIRRLRSPEPAFQGALGRYVAIQGTRAYAVDLNSRVCCFDITTGKRLWKNRPMDEADFGGLTMKSGLVEHLAVDGDLVLAGIPTGWVLDLPLNGFAVGQGMLARMLASNGKTQSAHVSLNAEENATFGASVARAGGITLIGEPLRDYGGLADSGLVNIHLDSNHRYELALPGASGGDRFGAAVAILRDRLLVSAPGRDVNGRSDAGTVLVIDKSTSAVVKQMDAPASLAAGAAFGRSLSAHGSLAVIGANGSSWLYDTIADKLVPLNPPVAPSAQYGCSVAINSSSIVVVDPAATGGQATKGRAYLFAGFGRELPAGGVIARTKAAAPGTASTFLSFGETGLSSAGKVIFTATVAGGGASLANNGGLWSTLGGSLDLVLRENDSNGTAKVLAPAKPLFAPDGKGRFLARHAGTLSQNLFTDDGMTVNHSMGEGAPLIVNGTTLTIGKIHDFVGSSQASSTAMVACSARTGTGGVTLQNDSRIGRKTPSFMLDEAREGNLSAISGVSYGQIAPRVASNGGRIAFVTAIMGVPTATNSALITKNIGISDEKIIARKGDPAPGAGTAKFSSFVSESLNLANVVFRATLTGGASGVTSGVWRSQIGAGNVVNTTAVALRNHPAPGLAAGVKFVRFIETFIADGGAIALRAQVAGPGVGAANDVGIWAYSQGVLSLLMREGDAIPGGKGARIGTIQRFDLGGSSHYAVLVSLAGAPSSRNQAILTGHFLNSNAIMWQPAMVVQKGSLIDRPTPMPIKGLGIARNHVAANGAGTKGIAKQIGDHGLLFSATFANSTDLILAHP